MLRLNLVLLLAVVANALYLVQVQYQSRRLFVEVEKSQSLARRLEVDREKLEVDKRSLATPSRVERLAKDQLGMRSATPAVTQYVKAPSASSLPAATATTGGSL